MDNMINMPTQNNVVAESPVSTVRLYSGVPWDDSYEHVRLYASSSALLSALETYKVHTISNMAPVRVGELTVRVPYEEVTLLEINYLAFQNPNISSEWIFCFVTEVAWQSRNSTVVRFKLDIFQNNIYKATFKPCFIERSHIAVSDDTIGGNLVEDNLDPGEMRTMGMDTLGFGQRGIAIMVSELTDGSEITANGLGNVMNATMVENWYAASGRTFSELCESVYTNRIYPYVQNGNIDAVINVYMTCKLCTDENEATLTIDRGNLFGGYTPKNNKLYQYPYCYVVGSNENGSEAVYKYELSSGNNHYLYFNARGEQSPMPVVILRNVDYDGISGISYQHALKYSNFGQCSWKSDVYTAWLAQNRNTIAYSAASAAIQPLKGAIQGAGVGAVLGGVGSVAGAAAGAVTGAFSTFDTMAQMMAQAKDREIVPPEMHGKADAMNTNAAFGIERFVFYKKSCNYDVAKSIDDYWSAFGYPIRAIQTPNLSVRPSWNYIKTVGCNIQGNIDLAQRSQLREIFDRGVTIWHTDDVGNYSLSNE